MTGPGNGPADPPLSISTTTPGDVPAVNALVFASKASWGYPPELMELWRDDLTVRPHHLDVMDACHAVVAGQLAGMYLLDARSEEAELLALFVAPASIGTGVGAALFRHAAARAAERGAGQLLVESDPHATGFYERMGCRLVGERPSVPEGRMLPLLRLDLPPPG